MGALVPPRTVPVIIPGIATTPMTIMELMVGVRPVAIALLPIGSAASLHVAPFATSTSRLRLRSKTWPSSDPSARPDARTALVSRTPTFIN